MMKISRGYWDSSYRKESMEKNWLIRTRSKKILGPISKEKLIEFVNKGSLIAEDEITSGNGYWFKVKEKDLLEKYIFGDIPQSFNPISEAPNILTAFDQRERETTASFKPSGMPKEIIERTNSGKYQEAVVVPSDDDLDYPDLDVAIPEQEDLEYPDLDMMSNQTYDFEFDDHTIVSSSLNLNDLKKELEKPVKQESKLSLTSTDDEFSGEIVLPDSSELEYPEIEVKSERKREEAPLPPPVSKLEIEKPTSNITPQISDRVQKKVTKKKAVKRTKALKVSSKQPVKSPKGIRNDFVFLFLLLGLVLMAFYGVYYYWTEVLHKDLPFVTSVQAQEVSLPLKKKH